MRASWTLDDIDWHLFDPSAIETNTLAAVKSAALVEFNSRDYVEYLDRVFADDPATRDEIAQWGVEEQQHGEALGRWAQLADPDFDFAAAIARFREGYRVHPDAIASVRGSQSGEMIARCIVECGTSSFYSSLRDGVREPVLRQIADLIARDEFHHYRLFHTAYERYAPRDRLGPIKRLRIAVGRIAEADDDELAFAHWSANVAPTGRAYDRAECFRAQQRLALRHYRQDHVRRAVHMISRAVGLKPTGALVRVASHLTWHLMRRRGATA
jgi:hypothetical protein